MRIFIFAALRMEAEPVIKRLGLQLDKALTRYSVYQNEMKDILLTVTGVGPVNAAAAVSAVCTRFEPVAGDKLINYGMAGSDSFKVGEIFRVNKIKDMAAGREFYPDILTETGLPEAGLETTPVVKKISKDDKTGALYDMVPGILYDMEGAAVFQVGSKYFDAHEMTFIKIVSDNAEESSLGDNAEERSLGVNTILNPLAEAVIGFVSTLKDSEEKSADTLLPSDTLMQDLKLSVSMEHTLKSYFRLSQLLGFDIEGFFSKLYEEKKVPVRSKRDAAKILEELRRELINRSK